MQSYQLKVLVDSEYSLYQCQTALISWPEVVRIHQSRNSSMNVSSIGITKPNWPVFDCFFHVFLWYPNHRNVLLYKLENGISELCQKNLSRCLARYQLTAPGSACIWLASSATSYDSQTAESTTFWTGIPMSWSMVLCSKSFIWSFKLPWRNHSKQRRQEDPKHAFWALYV